MKKECQYCHRPVRKVSQARTTYWQCDYHGATVVKYLFAEDNGVVDQEWVTTIMVCLWKEQTYHVVFIHNTTDPVKFRIDKVLNVPYTKYGSPKLAEAVVSLNFLPVDITPENVSGKLSTYLLFS